MWLLWRERWLTGIDGRDDAFHDEHWQCIESRQGVNRLTDSRQLGDHVQEHGDEGQETQPQSCSNAISLPCPLGEDEALGTLLADDRTQGSEDQQWQSRRQGVDKHALDTGDGG